MPDLSVNAKNFGWLLDHFVESTSGVTLAIAVSADGILLAESRNLDRAQGEQFAAITSGITSLTQGAARCFSAGQVEQVIVEMQGAFLFVTAISLGSSLGVIAEKDSEMGLIAYEMTRLVERCGALLTPQLIHELKNLVEA